MYTEIREWNVDILENLPGRINFAQLDEDVKVVFIRT
jgi:hypothetical protein